MKTLRLEIMNSLKILEILLQTKTLKIMKEWKELNKILIIEVGEALRKMSGI